MSYELGMMIVRGPFWQVWRYICYVYALCVLILMSCLLG